MGAQFAFVHYFTKYGFGEVYFSDLAIDENDDEKADSADEISPIVTPTSSPARKVVPKPTEDREGLLSIFF